MLIKSKAVLLLTFFALMFGLTTTQVASVEPDEVLKDPKLEQRARKLSLELRCLVCQNQSIDDSNAPLAKDLRVLVRERLKAGDTDSEVIDYIVARYGEFVLLRPRFALHTLLLWISPLILLIFGIYLIYRVSKGNTEQEKVATSELSDEENQKVKDLLDTKN